MAASPPPLLGGVRAAVVWATGGVVRILTLWEPWATLMAIGAKRIETRSWATRYRGPLAIHAARGGLKLWELHGLLNQKPFREAFSRASNADAKTVSGYLRAKINGRTVDLGTKISADSLSIRIQRA